MMRLDASSCVEPFGEFNSHKTDVAGLLFKVDNPAQPHAIQLEASLAKSGAGNEEDWRSLCAQLPADDCRFGLCVQICRCVLCAGLV